MAAGMVLAVGLMAFVSQNATAAEDVAADIAKVQAATKRFEDVKVALAEGYVPAPPGECVSAEHEGLPPEMGAMGIHYMRPDLLKITTDTPRVDGGSIHTDFTNPAILLYEPQADGSLALVGVENLVFMNAWHAAGHHAPPSFAGRIWDTMADDTGTAVDEAHNFQPHHDQHVYFRKMDNPADQLEPFSPKVSCKYAK
jgi:hypothetical protein